jgi:hypothetical protein
MGILHPPTIDLEILTFLPSPVSAIQRDAPDELKLHILAAIEAHRTGANFYMILRENRGPWMEYLRQKPVLHSKQG